MAQHAPFPKTNKALLALIIPAMMAYSAQSTAQDANEPEVTLDTLNVTVNAKPKEEVGEEIIARRELDEQMVQNSHDLVRYIPDVGIADNGRRQKGFAMRGVEGNRVGVSLDGVSLPDSEENSLYARYGNFNNSRLVIDPELVKSVSIQRGSDSFGSGSGSLGGTVDYRTLDASDIISNDNFGVYLKSGYNSKNSEWTKTAGIGYSGNSFEGVLLYSQRRGHELKSAGGSSGYDLSEWRDPRDASVGSDRIDPDPSAHKNDNYLAKFAWYITPNHRIGTTFAHQDNSNFTQELSYSLTNSWRDADDQQKLDSINTFYEFIPDNSQWLDKARLDLDFQKVESGAINYKGNYDRHGNWIDGYSYTKGMMTERDYRLNKSKYKRVSGELHFMPFDLGTTNHTVFTKVSLSERDFKNVNTDDDLNADGSIKTQNIYTIQRPMKTDHYSVLLQDNVIWNDRYSTSFGIRHDATKIQAQDTQAGVPCAKATCANTPIPADKTFKDWSGFVNFKAKLNDTWQAGYQIGTGFRVPTASEMYFTYTNPYGNWLSNPDLNSEKSLTQTLSLQGKNKKGELDVAFHHTKYKDFLYEQETIMEIPNEFYGDWYACYIDKKYCEPTLKSIAQQMQNIDKATVTGIDIQGRLDLHETLGLKDGLYFVGSAGYSKGTLKGEHKTSLLSIQPFKAVIGLDYLNPNGKWGLSSRLTYQSAKQSDDAQITMQDQRDIPSTCRIDYSSYQTVCDQEYYTQVRDYYWLSKSYRVFDIFGHYRFNDNVTLRAGIYNLFDEKYHTWDSLRGINARSTINSLDWRDANAKGLERFYAPGRNYAISLTYEF